MKTTPGILDPKYGTAPYAECSIQLMVSSEGLLKCVYYLWPDYLLAVSAARKFPMSILLTKKYTDRISIEMCRWGWTKQSIFNRISPGLHKFSVIVAQFLLYLPPSRMSRANFELSTEKLFSHSSWPGVERKFVDSRVWKMCNNECMVRDYDTKLPPN